MSPTRSPSSISRTIPGPYANAGYPTLQSPTLETLGFRIVIVDLIASWETPEWQNFIAFVAAVLLYVFMRRIPDADSDVTVFHKARMALCFALAASWFIEAMYIAQSWQPERDREE
jgi:hypothetical protein